MWDADAAVRRWIHRRVSPTSLVRLRAWTRHLPMPRWGNLRRTAPFSTHFGFERGTPVDRYYIDEFFGRHRDLITGDVLEIQVPAYTTRFGTDLRTVHTVDRSAQFSPTYLCDLACSADTIPSDTYDCFLLPSTLSFLRDLPACLRHAVRVVKPGGAVLATGACLIPLVPDMPDYWRLSADGLREVVRTALPPSIAVEVEARGNCLAAVAAMYGLALEELTPAELDYHDGRYPVTVMLVLRKPP